MPSLAHDRTGSVSDPTGTRRPGGLSSALLFANAAALVAAFLMPELSGTGAMLRLVKALA